MRSRIVPLLGTLLALVTLAFIGVRLWQDRQVLAEWQPDGTALLGMVAAILVYTGANIPLSLAWIKLLHNTAVPLVDTSTLIGVYARSQFAKYLPGNVVHLAGRHILGRRCGYEHGPLAIAAVLEMILVMMAAIALIAIGGLAPELRLTGNGSIPGEWALPLLAVGLLLAMYGALRWLWPWLRRHYPNLPNLSLRLRRLFLPLIEYALFFAMGGFALALVIRSIENIDIDQELPRLVAIFASTWLIGFVTPGAPSGIGVREAAMVLLLQPSIGSAWAVLAAVLLRVVTMLGDLLFFCVGLLLQRSVVPGPADTTPNAKRPGE